MSTLRSSNASPGGPRWLLVYGTAFFALSMEGMIGLIVPIVLLDLGASPRLLGFLVSLSALGPLFLSLPAGALCDRFGDRRVLIVCAIGALITSALYFFTTSFLLFGILQLIGGTARSVGWLASQSYIARHVPEAQRATRMGHFTFAANLSMLLTPPLVGVLSGMYGVRSGFAVMAVWSVFLLMLAYSLRERFLETKDRNVTDTRRNLFEVMFYQGARMAVRPAVTVILIVTFLRLATVGISQSFYPVYLSHIGYSPTEIGTMFSLMFAASTLASSLMGRLSRLIGSKNVLWVATTLSIAGIATVVAVESVVAVAFVSILHGIGIGLSLPALLAEVGAATAKEERGVALALRTVLNRLGYLLMPATLGGLVSLYGITSAFIISGIALFFLMAMAMAIDKLGTGAP